MLNVTSQIGHLPNIHGETFNMEIFKQKSYSFTKYMCEPAASKMWHNQVHVHVYPISYYVKLMTQSQIQPLYIVYLVKSESVVALFSKTFELQVKKPSGFIFFSDSWLSGLFPRHQLM